MISGPYYRLWLPTIDGVEGDGVSQRSGEWRITLKLLQSCSLSRYSSLWQAAVFQLSVSSPYPVIRSNPSSSELWVRSTGPRHRPTSFHAPHKGSPTQVITEGLGPGLRGSPGWVTSYKALPFGLSQAWWATAHSPPGLIIHNKAFDEGRGGGENDIWREKKCPFSTQTKDEIKWFRGQLLQVAERASVKLIYFPRPAEKAAPGSFHMHENVSPET